MGSLMMDPTLSRGLRRMRYGAAGGAGDAGAAGGAAGGGEPGGTCWLVIAATSAALFVSVPTGVAIFGVGKETLTSAA